MWNQILWSMELCYLAICARSDIRTGWISVPFSIVCAVAGMIVRYTLLGIQTHDILWDLFHGLLAMLVAVVSRGSFGMGDAWMILVSGVVLGNLNSIAFVWWAFLVAGIYGIWSIARKKKNRKDSFPFAPCMLAGYVLGAGRYWL